MHKQGNSGKEVRENADRNAARDQGAARLVEVGTEEHTAQSDDQEPC